MSKSRELIKKRWGKTNQGSMAEVEAVHKHNWKELKSEYCTKCNWIRGWKNKVEK